MLSILLSINEGYTKLAANLKNRANISFDIFSADI